MRQQKKLSAGGLISNNFNYFFEIVQILISMALLLFLAIDREKVKHLNTFDLGKNQKDYWGKRRG